jgi:hypothetical protein
MHAAAAIVAAHDDVLDLELLDRVLDDRERADVIRDDHVGDVAVHKHLAGREPCDLLGGHARVGAADPEIPWRLLLGRARKERRLDAHLGVAPAAVVLKEVLDRLVVGLHLLRA